MVKFTSFVGDAKYASPVTQKSADATSIRIVSVGLKTVGPGRYYLPHPKRSAPLYFKKLEGSM